MALRRSHSALLSKYLEQYKQRPGSRVFAPLAEAYRKLGMIDEALKVLKEGIKRNPSYVLGYVVLAQVYADQHQWERVYETLLPLTDNNKDNIALQKLYARACLETGELESALSGYKWLLFLNPRDQEFARQVASLEDDLLARQRTIPREALVKAPTPTSTSAFDVNEDDWTMVNFSSNKVVEVPADDEANWEMTQKPLAPSNNPDEWKVMSRELDDEFFSDEEVTPEYAEAPVAEEAQPLVSHTLVDLYLAQNHIPAAIELLEKFVAANPKDQRSRERLVELKSQQMGSRASLHVAESDGHEELLRLVQTQVKSSPVKIEKMFQSFLQHIQLRAEESRTGHV